MEPIVNACLVVIFVTLAGAIAFAGFWLVILIGAAAIDVIANKSWRKE